MTKLPSPARGERMRARTETEWGDLAEIEPDSEVEFRATGSASLSADINKQRLPHTPEIPFTEAAPFPDSRDNYALAILAAAVALMFW